MQDSWSKIVSNETIRYSKRDMLSFFEVNEEFPSNFNQRESIQSSTSIIPENKANPNFRFTRDMRLNPARSHMGGNSLLGGPRAMPPKTRRGENKPNKQDEEEKPEWAFVSINELTQNKSKLSFDSQFIYIDKTGKIEGPVSLRQLQEWLELMIVDHSTKVKRTEEFEFTTLGEVLSSMSSTHKGESQNTNPTPLNQPITQPQNQQLHASQSQPHSQTHSQTQSQQVHASQSQPHIQTQSQSQPHTQLTSQPFNQQMHAQFQSPQSAPSPGLLSQHALNPSLHSTFQSSHSSPDVPLHNMSPQDNIPFPSTKQSNSSPLDPSHFSFQKQYPPPFITPISQQHVMTNPTHQHHLHQNPSQFTHHPSQNMPPHHRFMQHQQFLLHMQSQNMQSKQESSHVFSNPSPSNMSPSFIAPFPMQDSLSASQLEEMLESQYRDELEMQHRQQQMHYHQNVPPQQPMTQDSNTHNAFTSSQREEETQQLEQPSQEESHQREEETYTHQEENEPAPPETPTWVTNAQMDKVDLKKIRKQQAKDSKIKQKEEKKKVEETRTTSNVAWQSPASTPASGVTIASLKKELSKTSKKSKGQKSVTKDVSMASTIATANTPWSAIAKSEPSQSGGKSLKSIQEEQRKAQGKQTKPSTQVNTPISNNQTSGGWASAVASSGSNRSVKKEEIKSSKKSKKQEQETPDHIWNFEKKNEEKPVAQESKKKKKKKSKEAAPLTNRTVSKQFISWYKQQCERMKAQNLATDDMLNFLLSVQDLNDLTSHVEHFFGRKNRPFAESFEAMRSFEVQMNTK